MNNFCKARHTIISALEKVGIRVVEEPKYHDLLSEPKELSKGFVMLHQEKHLFMAGNVMEHYQLWCNAGNWADVRQMAENATNAVEKAFGEKSEIFQLTNYFEYCSSQYDVDKNNRHHSFQADVSFYVKVK